MKKTIIKSFIFSAVMLTALVLPSCKKYLEVTDPSTLGQEAVFSSVSYTNSTVIGIYNQLIGDNGYGNRISCLFPQTADDFKTSGSYSPTDRRGISNYKADPFNTDLVNPYNQLYTGIERANICIKFIPLSSIYTSGSPADQASMKKYLGESLALRAQFYFELVRNWGDVIAQFVPSADVTNYNVTATKSQAILDHLLDDLKTAEDMVPWRTESGYTDTRFTKGAIKGLRARIALFRGGYLLSQTSHVPERDPNYKSYYQIAMTECADVMARRDQHDLNPVYENVFRTLHAGTRYDDKYELMFRVGAFGGNATTDSKLGYYNGMIFNAASVYGSGGGGINAIPTYFYEFDQLGDCRRDVTIASYSIDANGQKVLSTANTLNDGKFRRSWSAIIGGTAQNFGIDWPVLRFADILLMYAEADNEINGAPSVTAQNALMEVKKRAFVGFESRIPVTPTDHDGFFTAVVKERLLEFGGEGIRKYDLIRWNLMQSKFDETRLKIAAFAAGTGAYANMPLYVYNKPANYSPTNSAVIEENSLDNYGGPGVASPMFQPGLGTSAAPTGYTTKNWRAAISTNATTGDAITFAQYYVPERQVFPYPAASLLLNTNLVQNYGY
jgi:hypothetical protein